MPKIIKDLRDSLLSTGKRLLFKDGYSKLTIRSVANECGIAVGTIYNYFPSKDVMVAYIMFEDWQKCIEKAKLEISDVETCIDGLGVIFNMIKEYSETYINVWKEYGGSLLLVGDKHKMLISQISEIVSCVLTKFGSGYNPNPSIFISEILLHAGSQCDVTFENIKCFLLKLI